MLYEVITCEAEITDEYDLLESRGAGESPAGNDRSNGPLSAQGKDKYPATGRDRYIAGNVLAFPQRARRNSGNKVAPREHRPCFGVSVETRAFFICHRTLIKIKTRKDVV